MMKLLSMVALTSGGVTSVTAATTTTNNENTKEQKQQQQQLVGSSSISPNRKLDTITTHQLQKDTNQFVQDNINSIRFIHSNNDKDITNNNNEVVQQGDEEQNNRALRSRKFRQKKQQFGGEYWHSPSWDEWGSEWGGPGKSGKSGAPSWGKKWSGKTDKSWHASWDDVGWHSDSWSGSRSGKGGFLSRDKWDDKWDNSGGDWSHSRSWDFDNEWFYMLPAACPNECVSSHLSGNYEFIDSIKECREYEETQLWGVVSDGSYIMIESYDQKGKCIAVDYKSGDSDLMVAKTCFNGELVLKDCHDTEYGTEWYFTGGQLVNSFCWAAGLSSVMTVLFTKDSKKNFKKCDNDLLVWGGSEDPLLKADTFMFVNSLPETPVYIEDLDKILDGKIPKGPGSQ